jgi:hypothetical protein
MPNTIGRIQKFATVNVGIHLGEPAIEDVLASDVLDVLLENPDVNVLTDAEYALLSEFVAISGANEDFMQIKAGVWTNRTPTQVKIDLGIDNVNNTSDMNKPVSTAQALADALVLSTAQAYTDASLLGFVEDKGNYDPSANSNLYPSVGGILKGWLYTISNCPTATVMGGVSVTNGDLVRALVDTPGQIDANWAVTENNIGYVAENQNNKAVNLSSPDNIKYPTTLAITNALAFKQDSNINLTDIALISLASGDILYYDGLNIVNLGIGSNGQVLKVTGGLPSWGAGGGGSGRSDAPTTTVNASAGASVDMMTSKNVEVIMNTNVVGLTCPVDPTEEGTPLVLTVTMGATPYTMTLGSKFEGGLDNPIPSPFLDATINKSGIYHFAWNRVNAKWTFLGMERKRG